MGNQVTSNVLSLAGSVIGNIQNDEYSVYFKDMQGSTSSIAGSGGALKAAYRYSDFGEMQLLTDSSYSNEICYTGAVYDDSTGLYYMNARYYSPEDGRFISQDSYRGEKDDPGQWHLYAYCANNPINYVDPSGHLRLGLALAAGNYIIKGSISTGISIAVGTSSIAIMTVVAVIGTVYVAGYTYKKIRVTYSKGGKQNKRHSDLLGYSDKEISALSKDKRLSKKERKRFVSEDKWRKNRNRQKRETGVYGGRR